MKLINCLSCCSCLHTICIQWIFIPSDILSLSQPNEIPTSSVSALKDICIISLLILVFFIILLYKHVKLRQKTDRKIKIRDQQIIEHKAVNTELSKDKEWLLKEIQDRVKNNLQIVISLLNTQSAYIDNDDALNAIQNSKYRMHAMSLMHQKIYQSDNLSYVDMSCYISELINYIKECFEINNKIRFIVDTSKVNLDLALAIPIGLIINEALSNAVKYAFPKHSKGEIRISLKNTDKNNYKLIIADNGIGFPKDYQFDKRETLGMNLIVGLSNQIDGIFELENENGLKITITFTKN